MKAFVDKYNYLLNKHLKLKNDRNHQSQTFYNLSDWKNLIFILLIHILIFFGVPLLLFGSTIFYKFGHWLLGGIESSVAVIWIVTILVPQINLNIKKFIIIVSLYFLGLFLLFNTGMHGAGFIIVNFSLILSGCILEKKEIKKVIIMNVGIFIILTVLMFFGLLSNFPIGEYKGFWLINSLSTQVTGLGLLGLMHIIYMGLDKQNIKIKASKQDLQATEIKYKDMMSNIFDVITILDENGIIIYKSPNINNLFGWDSAELLGKSFFTYIHEEDQFGAREVFKDMLNHPGEKLTKECRFRKSCGKYVCIEITGINLLDYPSIKGILANYRDMTPQKETEKELLDAKEMAERASLVKGQFLSVMSHEIRTPLNGIMGMLQLLDMTSLTEEQENYLSISNSASNHLLTLINDILDYSKMEVHKIELEIVEIEVQEIIEEVENLFLSQVKERDIEFEIYIDKSIPKVLLGDKHRTKQVLFNLMSNAIKFTSDGTIKLSVDLESTSEESATLKWSVKDTGIGLSESQTKRIFDIFSQGESSTTRQYGGTGLGLSISKGLVELMGGRIWVDSTVDMGSEFTFTSVFGKHNLTNSINKEVTGVFKEDVHKEIRVLIVEDDDFSRFLLQKLGGKLGWIVTLAENGKRAIDEFAVGKFDLILMDVSMPILDGIGATKEIRKIDKTITIIAVSAFALPGDGQKCIDHGMNDYISKPVDMMALKTIISKWL